MTNVSAVYYCTCIGTATDKEGACVGINGGQAGDVLPHVLQILEGRRLFLHDSCHAAQSAALELLAPVERVTIFEQFGVVAGHLIHKVPGHVDLAQRQLVVVLVVQRVQQVSIEGV